ncbi:hypothetical protein M513_01641 [Trichuris suis]|uniref:E3 SUMO-protein ligase RanBP2 n=1 Tax=Trichuris suis TaxID=68888 RepID=A0A085MJZ2_9BILA|nr:hypothetical protein M513_01641 [Trichuris suis]
MNEESEKFHDALQDFERYCSMKLKKDALSSFVEMLKWFAKHEATASRGKEWQNFIAYCRCQIISCYATLLMHKLQQAGNRTGSSEANNLILACYSYSMVLQLAPNLKSIPKGLWWSANCVFSILESHHMLSSLLLKREVKADFFAALKSNSMTDLITRSAHMFTLNPKFKIDELLGIFGGNSCQGKVDLDVEVYRSAIRYLILHDTTAVALRRLVWILLFNWDPGKELILRNDHEEAFDKLAYAPEDFNDTSIENLTVLDMSAFIHLSVFAAASSSKGQQEKLPFVLSGNIAIRKTREAIWSSVNAYVAACTGPNDVENIKQFLCYVRLTQRPLPCLSLLHTAARMLYSKVDESRTFLSKDAKLRAIDYCNAYWCAIEDIVKGEKRAQDDSYLFTFCERAFSSEEHQSMLDESFFYRAKLLLHRGEPIEAERMLRNCTSPTAARLHLELCKHLADSIDSNDSSKENQCRKNDYQKLINSISERLSTVTDGFDESILSNQEVSLIETATKRKFSFEKRELHKPTGFQSNAATFVGHHHGAKNCECRESFERLFEAYQQILLRFGGLIETIPDMFSTSVKCIAEQNKQLMLFLQELLKSGTLTTEKKAPQAAEFEQYLKMLLNYFPSHQAPAPPPSQGTTVYAAEPAQSYPFFSSSLAPAAGQQFQPTVPPSSVNPPPSMFLQPAANLSGWPNVFSFGSFSQPPPATQTTQSVSLGLDNVGSTGKTLFPKLTPAQAPPPLSVAPASVTHADKGFFSNLPAVSKVQPAAMPKQFAATTAAFPRIAPAVSTTPSQFGKMEYRDVKFGFGTPATPTTRENEAPPSIQKNQFAVGTVGKDSQVKTKSPPFGGPTFGIPKSTPAMPTAGQTAETKSSTTKGGEDVVDTAAVQKPFIGTTARVIQPAVLSVPFGTGTPLFSSSTAKTDVPVLRSSWPPTKAQEVPKGVPQKDQRPSTVAMPQADANVKPNGCIPASQLQSFIETQKSVKSESTLAETTGLFSVEESGHASESEESEEEVVAHYKPVVPLPDLIEVVTGEENEIVIFKERAKMFRYHKETKEYKECGIGDLKLLKHPQTNKYRIVMRREMVHKICANQFLYAGMQLKPMANRQNAYCWIANDYSNDELVTALFAARFRNEQAASNFKETFEKCIAEVKLQDEAAKHEQDVKPPSAQSVSEQKEEEKETKSTESKAPPGKESPPTAASSLSKGEQKATEQSESFSFGKAKEGVSFSFGPSVLSSTPIMESLTPRGATFVFPKLDSKQEDSKPGSTVLSTSTQEASVSEEERKSDDDEVYDDSYEPDICVEPIVPLPELVDVVTGEENEQVLFCERTRLFRVSAGTAEYKERGTGNLKILKDPTTGRIRLVMRRDVILNVIANHWITADMQLNKHNKASNTYFWQCQNYFGEGDVAYETVAAKFKNEEAADKFYSQFMNAVEADRARTQDKGKDVVANGFQDSKATSEDKKGDLKFELPPGSWICSSCSVPNDSTRTRCICCNEAKQATPSKVSASVSSSESKERPSTDNRSLTPHSTSACSYSQDTPSEAVEVSGSSVEATNISTDTSNTKSTRQESFQTKNEVSAENADTISTSTIVEHEDERINLYPAVQRLLQRYGYMLKVDTAWPNVLFKGIAGLSFQREDNGYTRCGPVELQIEQQLETCSYGRIIAYNKMTKAVCCNHFIKEVIQCHKCKDAEWSWTVMDRSTGELRSYVARFASTQKMAEFLRAWKEAKGRSPSKLASSQSSQAISVLCGAFSKRTAQRYSKLARQLSLSSDFFEYLLKDGCRGCRACESFNEERSPDILVFDQACLLYMRDKEVRCRIEVWYLERKQCYWIQMLREDTEATIHELYESEPFSDVKEINRAKLRISCNLDINSYTRCVGITFLNESAFDEFRHTFLDTSSVDQSTVKS